MLRARQNGTRHRPPRFNAPYTIFESCAVSVIDQRKFSTRIVGVFVFGLPRRHPVLAVLAIEFEPVVPTAFIERKGFCIEKLSELRQQGVIHQTSSPRRTKGCIGAYAGCCSRAN